MRLEDWMKKNDLSDARLAEMLGHKRTDSVRRWKEGEFRPNETHMQKIKEITKGQVTANSFYE